MDPKQPKPKPKLYKFIFTYAENDNDLENTKEREIITTNCQNALRLFHNTVKQHIGYMITNIAITKNDKALDNTVQENKPTENTSGLYLKGESKYQIKKIILEDDKEIEFENVTHVLICKERNVDEKQADYNISYKVIQKRDYQPLSNQMFMMSNVLKLMGKYDFDFETAMKHHADLITSLKNKIKK